MPTAEPTCANCDAAIGKLEKRFDWDGQTVCAACHVKLVRGESAIAVEAQGVRSSGPWKYVKGAGGLISLAGLLMTAVAFYLGKNDVLGYSGLAFIVFGAVIFVGGSLGGFWFGRRNAL